ncbi:MULTISPECIES: YceD family protein [unclassified Marinovum]
MSQKAENSRQVLVVSSLPQNRPHRFELIPGEAERAALARELGATSVRKVKFEGEIKGRGKRDFVLTATLGATVIQPCVQTLAPVTTRIDTEVVLRYVADWDDLAQEGAETEMSEDVTTEPLPSHINLKDVMTEALALNVPDYPRATDAPPLGNLAVTEPGKAPMTDEDTKPFAGLAALRNKLSGEDDA